MVAKFLGSLFGNGVNTGPVAEGHVPVDPVAEELATIGRLLSGLRADTLRNGSRLPTIVVSQVLCLVDTLQALHGYIRNTGAATEQLVLLAAIAGDYLPVPLRSYTLLGAPYRSEDSPETAVLLEQLETLRSTVKNLDNQVRTGAVTELAVHGQFLRDKFDIDGLHLEGH
ncbi:hypothetical protein ACIPYU_19580 [Paenarthrobacter nicotinovorans]|uniref:hypothetical protein n=1 Tax=Paenarthrobacter nicotinovorans TaxID=29320 RepID=UPI00381E601D